MSAASPDPFGQLGPESSGGAGLHALDVEALLGPVRLGVKALFLIYAIVSLTGLLPLQLRNPGWYQNQINNLINNAALPLVGLVLLLLARVLASESRPTRQLLRWAVRWSLAAAVGFLLLVPLQLAVSIKASGDFKVAELRAAGGGEKRIEAARRAIEAATDADQLRQATPFLPRPLLDQVTAQPLPKARRDLLQVLSSGEQRIRAVADSKQRQVSWSLGRETLRNVISALVLAAAFQATRFARIAPSLYGSGAPLPGAPFPGASPPA